MGREFGAVRSDATWRERYDRCTEEVCAVAAAEGAPQELDRLREFAAAAAPERRSSMEKDLEAGREPELDAIGGAVLRAAARHRIPTPVTSELVELVRERAAIRPSAAVNEGSQT
jgi:2-dehydropantoate 2-reductase